jgi:putative inorganic carbon (HCO3(-)) transporter
VSAPDRAPLLGFRLYAAHLFSVFSIALSNILLGLTVLASPWAVDRRAVSWRRIRPLIAATGLYALLLVISVATSYDPRLSFRALSELFSLSTLVLALFLVRGEAQLRRIVDGLILLGALLAVVGLGQFFWGFGDLEHRIRGPFSHYMTFAGVLLICDLLLLARLGFGRQRRSYWLWSALVVINAALVGSYTRSAWVGLIVALTLLLLLRAPRLLIGYLPAAALFVLLAPVPVLERAISIFDPTDTSNYDRLCMADAGLLMIAERPLFGQGPELVEHRYPIYRHPTAPRYWVPHLHNSFLQLAAERGLPALGAYVWMMGLGLMVAWRRFRAEGGAQGARPDLYLGVVLALVAFNVAGLFEDNWGDTEVQRLALFLVAVPWCLENPEEGSVG